LYLKKKLPMIPSQSAYSWAHVDDIAYAHILAMEKAAPGSKYIIAGECQTFSDALSTAKQISGIRKPLVVPPVILKISAFFSSLVEGFIPLPDMYRSEALRVQAGVTYLGDNSKAKKELGYNPRPLQQGLKETLEYEMRKMNTNKK
jgi:dihydroflavonol-4-reductase